MENADEPLRKRHIPWATIVLSIVAFTCHLLVLIGNCLTASAVHELGQSSAGWSKVGIGVARSMEVELDQRMHNVTEKLMESLEGIGGVQEALDTLLSIAGMETDAAINNTNLERMLLHQETPHTLSLMQVQVKQTPSTAIARLTPIILQTVHKSLAFLMDKVSDLLGELWLKLKPALEQVGEWLIKFGDKIQDGLEVFSMTLDRAQKIIDEVMEKLTGKGDNDEDMFLQTFNLFDVSNTGFITSNDLVGVAEIYAIEALDGIKSAELLDKYDESGDGQLDRKEFRRMVNDPSIPNAMPVLLRQYAKKLSQIGGIVRSVKRRDEIASAVVDYFQLVCAKNMTKVDWVADTLGNGTLPLEFTADVMARLCLSTDDPLTFTTADVGKTVVGELYKLHPLHTVAAMTLIGNTTFWVSAGLNIQDQPACVNQVLWWMINANTSSEAKNSTDTLSTTLGRGRLEESNSATEETVITTSVSPDILKQERGSDLNTVFSLLAHEHSKQVLQSLPIMAERIATENVAAYVREMNYVRKQRQHRLSSYTASQLMMIQLINGMTPSDKPSNVVEHEVISGRQASPETLQFAQWLGNNATTNAKIMQDMCFIYTSESSNALDSFAARVQGLVDKMRSFLTMMMKYATPEGIKRLEDNIQNFVENAMQDLSSLIERKIENYLLNHTPLVETMIDNAVQNASAWLGSKIGGVIGRPIGYAFEQPFVEMVTNMSSNPKAGERLGRALGQKMGGEIGMAAATILTNKTVERVEHWIDEKFHGKPNKVNDQPNKTNAKRLPATKPTPQKLGTNNKSLAMAFTADGAHTLVLKGERTMVAEDHLFDQLPTGVWEPLLSALRQLIATLPAAASNLRLARQEVAKETSILETLFVPLYHRGPPLFDFFSKFWRAIWIVYFLCLMPLCFFILYYGFWAGGFFGGPTPVSEEDDDDIIEPPRTWKERYALFSMSCTYFMKKHHDTELCFWSSILCMEVVVLILFVISIVLSIIGGVKFAFVAGCSQLYVLSDADACTDALSNLKTFLDTFTVSDPLESLVETCNGNALLTCAMISNKMKVSMILTGVFSFVATLVSLLMIMHSAQLHEQARWRRLANKVYAEQDAKLQTATGMA